MKNVSAFALFLIFSIVALISSAQKTTDKWHFGFHASLDFITSPPTVLSGSAIHTHGGTASVADQNGNLLFYTDGDTVYNSSHLPMANGNGILSAGSQTYTNHQRTLIVKKPLSTNIYYIFTQLGHTLSTTPMFGLRYATVDMGLAAGMGSVVAKDDTLFLGGQANKVAATYHCNGNDVWVVTLDEFTAQFRAFLVTAAGVNPVPVLSPSNFLVGIASMGQMKFSPNGKKLGMAASYNYYLFDFNNSTGIVSNTIDLGPGWFALGCEFSPDGSKFYGSSTPSFPTSGGVWQWNIAAGTNTAIISSRYTYTIPSFSEPESMQLASDGKIYLNNGSSFLHVIHSPNIAGAGSNYQQNGLLVPGYVGYSLPNFISGDFKQPMLPFTYTVDPLFSCNTASYSLSGPNPAITCTACGTNPLSISWDFGDPGSGGTNFSSAVNPQHVFNTPGTYTTNVVVNYGCSSNTFSQVITIAAIAPTVTISGNNTICFGEATSLTASGADLYQWISNAAAPQIQVSPLTTTAYSVIGTYTNGCSTLKTFTVNVSPCTVMKNNEAFVNFKMYPTPVQHSIIFIESAEPFMWEITDQLGRKILYSSKTDQYKEIDISELTTGIYYFKYSSATASSAKRIIKLE